MAERLGVETLQFALKIVSLSQARVVGSFAYPEHVYPSDIDAFDMVPIPPGAKTHRAIAADYAARFATIVRQLYVYGESGESVFFLDFKCGEDPKFLKRHREKAKDRADVMKLSRDLPLPEVERRRASALNPDDYNEFVRQEYVLRWSPAELIAGRHRKSGLSLAAAIEQGTTTKLDTAIWLEPLARFVSVEVWYQLQPFTQLPNYIESLLADVVKYSKITFNPLKLIKRAWLVARATGSPKLANLIEPVLRRAPAALNQVVADAELLEQILEQAPTGTITTLDQHRLLLVILGFQRRLSPFLPATVVTKLYATLGANPVPWLQSIQRKLKPLVDKYAEAFLKSVQPALDATISAR